MALSINTLYLLLVCFFLSGIQYSISTGKKENQYCGENKFYCPNTRQCFDRKQRCTESKICVDSGSGNEAKCFESRTAGRYDYYKAEVSWSISGSSSKRKRSIFNIYHWFVEYRGFVYEFGTYGFQELDVNDPYYKYGPGREKVLSRELQGSSSCTRDEVQSFIGAWLVANPEYRLFANNCQDFAKRLMIELEHDCFRRARRQDDVKESLKAHCPMNSTLSSSCSTFALNWKVYALVGTLVTFIAIYN